MSVIDNENSKCKGYKSKERAHIHWKILSQFLSKINTNKPMEQDENTPIQNFPRFELLTFQVTSTHMTPLNSSLFECSTTVNNNTYSAIVQFPKHHFTLLQVAGFDNSGNVCIWPSEEIMAYYALCNITMFTGKQVLELGGGMSCLAGLMIAKYSAAVRVDLTDGNKSSVQNIQDIIATNTLDKTKVSSYVLEWGKVKNNTNDIKYDIILLADCLFYEETHADLIEAMWSMLNTKGMSIVMAPMRGTTLLNFVTIAKRRGFHCLTKQHYDEQVWIKHLTLKEMPMYDENCHYPVLVELSR